MGTQAVDTAHNFNFKSNVEVTSAGPTGTTHFFVSACLLLDMEKQLEQTSVTQHQVKYASLNVTHPHVPIMIKLNLLSCDVEHHIIFQSLVTKHYFYYMVT
jgi:hypothetical protein